MSVRELPLFWTVDEVADMLRTSPKAVYVMAHRGLLPGRTKIGLRVLFRTGPLLEWLDHNSASSPRGVWDGPPKFGDSEDWQRQ